MKQKYIDYFKSLYDYSNELNAREITINYDFEEDNKDDLDCIDYLSDKGYIEILAPAIGFTLIRITPKGMEFAENGFADPISSPIIQGDNSIYVSGTNNTISNNYNQFHAEISSSDLPDEYKELLETFIYEIKNPSLSPNKKQNKVKEFISSVSKGALSSAGSQALILLISWLISNRPF